MSSDHLMALDTINLFSICLLDIKLVLFGMEQFKLTVTRNTVIKLLKFVFYFFTCKK